MGSLPHVMFTVPKPTKDSKIKPWWKFLRLSEPGLSHSPPQLTCFREKLATQCAVRPLGGAHPKSNRWWLFKINVYFNRTIATVAFAISPLWNYQHLMERTGLPKEK